MCTCYITHSGPNLIGLDWIDMLDIFSMLLNTVDTFALSSVSNIENYLTNSLKMKFSDVFTENLGWCTKIQTIHKLKVEVMPVFLPKHSSLCYS